LVGCGKILQVARPKKSILTPEIVVAAAIAMIGEGGLETFSMPKLASALGVRAPSLYHYFASKDALFAAVARTVLTPDAPTALPPDTQWTDYLVAISVALRRTIIAHPHCAPLVVRYMPRENMFDQYEQMCQFLAASGVPARLHVRIVDGMTALTIGAAILNENAADYTAHGDGQNPIPTLIAHCRPRSRRSATPPPTNSSRRSSGAIWTASLRRSPRRLPARRQPDARARTDDGEWSGFESGADAGESLLQLGVVDDAASNQRVGQ
jgi:AcrR family transcriptional regulator